jgi:metal-sulfur cluster biosynthetic enzyme
VSKSRVTSEQILKSLGTVMEPELHQDLVSLNMIRDIAIEDGKVSFTIMLTTPACPLKNKIESDARAAVTAIDGVDQVEIRMDSNVPTDKRITGQLDLDLRNTIAVSSGKWDWITCRPPRTKSWYRLRRMVSRSYPWDSWCRQASRLFGADQCSIALFASFSAMWRGVRWIT